MPWRIYPIGQAKAENESNSCIPLVKELETQEIEISAFFDQKIALVINSCSKKVEIAVDKYAKQIVITIGIILQTDLLFSETIERMAWKYKSNAQYLSFGQNEISFNMLINILAW